MKKTKIKKASLESRFGLKLQPVIQSIYRILPKDIPFSIVPKMKCRNCGAFKRKYGCPPVIDYDKIERLVRKARKCYVLISRTDGSIPWRDGLTRTQLTKKTDRGLKGASIGLQVYLQNLSRHISATSKGKVWVLGAGPCHECRKCTITKCQKGKRKLMSAEAAGVDVYALLDLLEENWEYPVKNFLTNVILVFMKGNKQ